MSNITRHKPGITRAGFSINSGRKEMNIDSSLGKPRFQIGDAITLVAPGFDHREKGNVIGVITGAVEHIHRYHVRFPSGKFGRVFRL